MNVKEQQFYFDNNDVLKDSELKPYVNGFFEHPIKNINLFDLYQIQIPHWDTLNGEYIFVGLETNKVKKQILYFLCFDNLLPCYYEDFTFDEEDKKRIYLHMYGMSKDKYQQLIKKHELYLSSVPYEYYKQKHKFYLKNVFNYCNVVKELKVFC